MLIRVPLFANSNFPSSLQTFIQISRRHFVKNQVTCLYYSGHMTKVSGVCVFHCSNYNRSEVFSVHVCLLVLIAFVLTLGFLCCDILLGPYVNAWCVCILCTIASWRNGIRMELASMLKYSRLRIIVTLKGNRKKFELSGIPSYRG